VATADVIRGEVGGCVSEPVPPATATVTDAVAVPALFEAVKRYVVVCAGETDREETGVTSPTPLSMLSADAPETVQDSVADCPLLILVGAAVNDVMVGPAGEEFAHETEILGAPVRS
jgi:hypothetical protein